MCGVGRGWKNINLSVSELPRVRESSGSTNEKPVSPLIDQSGGSMERVVSCLRSGGLTLATMSGVIGGVVFGLVLRGARWALIALQSQYLHLIG